MPVLQTERCELKLLSQQDENDICSLYVDKTVREFLGGVVSREEFPEKFQNMLIDADAVHFVVREKSNNVFIGLLTIDKHHDGHDYEISYQLSSAMQGKGYAYEAVQACIRYAFEAFKANRFIAETQSANRPSIKLLEKLGFTQEKQLERFGAMQSIYVIQR
ncbi:MAG: GNAT family N-acetyltransferase [Alphaproteobacteria bacterium]|nr:GNAT family N-acetyltransferase [Alphaproteobacteria bacterium]